MDMGSYRTELELRQMGAAWLTARRIDYGRRLQCTCQGGGCDQVQFDPGAFDGLGEDRPGLLAIGGEGFASILGSLRRGSLIVEDTRGALRLGWSARVRLRPPGG